MALLRWLAASAFRRGNRNRLTSHTDGPSAPRFESLEPRVLFSGAMDQPVAYEEPSQVVAQYSSEEGWIPFVPSRQSVRLEVIQTTADSNAGRYDAKVSVQFSDLCYRTTDWGSITRNGNILTINATMEQSTGGCFLQYPPPDQHTYSFGPLEVGPYQFEFKVNGEVVETATFEIATTWGEGYFPFVPSVLEMDVREGSGHWFALLSVNLQPGYGADFGTVTRTGNTLSVDATTRQWSGYVIAQYLPPAQIQIHLGALEPGSYTFEFKANGDLVETVTFEVPQDQSPPTDPQPGEPIMVRCDDRPVLAVAGEWYLYIEGLTGTRQEQEAGLQTLLGNAGVDATVARFGGYFLINTDPSIGCDNLEESLSSIPGFRYVKPVLAFSIPEETYELIVVGEDPPAGPSVSIQHGIATRHRRGHKVQFTVTLSEPATQAITVDFTTADGSAVSTGRRKDYIAQSGTLTFEPGETSKTVTVNVLPNRVGQGEEAFRMELRNPTGAYVSGLEGWGLIPAGPDPRDANRPHRDPVLNPKILWLRQQQHGAGQAVRA